MSYVPPLLLPVYRANVLVLGQTETTPTYRQVQASSFPLSLPPSLPPANPHHNTSPGSKRNNRILRFLINRQRRRRRGGTRRLDPHPTAIQSDLRAEELFAAQGQEGAEVGEGVGERALGVGEE
jgi:hypothetical protein